MTSGTIVLIIAALIIIFWVAPCFVMVLLLCYGHWDHEAAMKKEYYKPFHDEMESSIEFLESLSGRQITISAQDGVSLSARWFDNASKHTILLAHGFMASAYSNFCIHAKYFYEQGFNLLMIDQRAHGRSGGKAATFGIIEQYDIECWLKWLKSDTNSKTITAYGISMGSASIAYLSSKIDRTMLDCMILDCGFTSPYSQMEKVAKERNVPWRIMAPLVRVFGILMLKADLKQSVSEALSATEIPALFIHGSNDSVVDPSHCEINFNCCASDKEIIIIENSDHTTAFIHGGDNIRTNISQFIDKHTRRNV